MEEEAEIDAEVWLGFFGFGTVKGTQALAIHPVWGTHDVGKNGVHPEQWLYSLDTIMIQETGNIVFLLCGATMSANHCA